METYLIYIAKAAIAAGAFYIAFLQLFQNQKHFIFNRIYLPVSLALSFVIPLITFTTIKYIEPANFDGYSFAYLAPASGEIVQSAFVFEWYHYLFGLYVLGVLGFLFYLLLGHFKAIKIIQKSRIRKIFGSNLNITKKDVHPFSFFSKIVVSEKTLSHPDLEIIVSHENIHVREKHTLDILFTEIMLLFQWFNPFAWLLKDAVKNNLEYLTDNEIAKHYNPKTYQLAMVTLADKQGIAPFLTALNGSQLKNRIVMMKKKTENKYAIVKQLAVLPILAVLVMGLSNKEVKTEIIQTEQTEIQNGIIIKGNVTDEKGAPIEGASIEVKGKQFGVITDKKGNYKIEIEPNDETLIYGYLYHDKKEVNIDGKTIIDVQLETDGNPTTDGAFLHKSFRVRNSKGDMVKPLFIIDGKEAEIGNFQSSGYGASLFESKFLIDTVAVKIYGEKGENGVILITTKNSISESKTDNIEVVGYGNNENKQSQNGITIKATDGQAGQPLYVVDGVEVKSVENLKPDEIEKVDVLKGETGLKLYGEKGKNGVIEIKLKNYELKNETYLSLRKSIAQNIKYPVAAQENNQQGVVEVWAFIAKDGTISRITDKRPDGKFINIDEVVVTALKSEKAVTSEKSNDLALLVKESKRVIEQLSPLKVSELMGEMVCFRIQFVLQ